MKTKILDSLFKKAKHGMFVDLTKYIQIPKLEYNPENVFNENLYIKLEDIHNEYKLVKGKAGEIDFWEKVKFMFEQGKVGGYEDEKVYPINEKQAVVETLKDHATLYFWGPDEPLEAKEEEWLWENSEEYGLYIEGSSTYFIIYVLDIRKVKQLNKIKIVEENTK